MLLLPVTSAFIIVLVIMFIRLSLQVILYRRKIQVGVGDGQDVDLQRRIRVHGNFAEYTPFAVLLMLLAELQGVNRIVLGGIGLFFVVSRVFHAYGVVQNHERLRFRVRGMKGTFLTYGMLMMASAYKIISTLLD